MRCTQLVAAAIASVSALWSGPVAAWGPQTQTAVVSAGTRLLGQDSSFSLHQMLKYVVQGATISAERQRELFPGFSVDQVNAIQREMILLQAVRGDTDVIVSEDRPVPLEQHVLVRSKLLELFDSSGMAATNRVNPSDSRVRPDGWCRSFTVY